MKVLILFPLTLMLFSRCAINSSSTSTSECQKKFELIENNFVINKNSRFIRIKDNDQQQYVSGFITARFFFRGLNCFEGMKFDKIKKLLGQPHFIDRNYKSNIYQYNFNQGCTDSGEVCHYWEFIVDNENGKVLMFLERSRNIPDTGVE